MSAELNDCEHQLVREKEKVQKLKKALRQALSYFDSSLEVYGADEEEVAMRAYFQELLDED